jgi:hypothetical protein
MRITANDYNGREICLNLMAETQAEENQLTSLSKRLGDAGCRTVFDGALSVFLHKVAPESNGENS